MRRKILSTILALCMVMSMLPMTAFAAIDGGNATITATATVDEQTVNLATDPETFAENAELKDQTIKLSAEGYTVTGVTSISIGDAEIENAEDAAYTFDAETGTITFAAAYDGTVTDNIVIVATATKDEATPDTYTITVSDTNLTVTPTSGTKGEALTEVTLALADAVKDTHELPETITKIAVGTSDLTADTNYTYDKATGKITFTDVTPDADVVITATATQKDDTPSTPTAAATNVVKDKDGALGTSITVTLTGGTFEANPAVADFTIAVAPAEPSAKAAAAVTGVVVDKDDSAKATLTIDWGETTANVGDEITVSIAAAAIADYEGEAIVAKATVTDGSAVDPEPTDELLTSVLGQNITVTGDGNGTTAGTPKTAAIEVPAATTAVKVTDIVVADGATPALYSDAGFETAATADGIALAEDETVVYIKVTVDAADTYYKVTINKAAEESAYTVTLKANPANGGTVTAKVDNTDVKSGSEVEAGKDVVITATPVGEYTFTSMTVNGETVDATKNAETGVATYTIEGLAADTEVVATFSQKTYEVTIGAITAGTGTAALVGGPAFAKGATVELTTTPAEGYVTSSVTAVYDTNKTVEVNYDQDTGKYSFTMPDAAVTVNVEFTEVEIKAGPIDVDESAFDTAEGLKDLDAAAKEALTESMGNVSVTADAAALVEKNPEAKDALLKAMKENEGATIEMVVYTAVTPVAYTPGAKATVTVDIAQMSKITKTEGVGDPVTIGTPTELTVTGDTPVTIGLPTGFAAKDATVYVTHKTDVHEAAVAEDAGALTVTVTANGLSPFTVSIENPAVAKDDNNKLYTTLEAAIKGVANNGTITLLKDVTLTEDIVINEAKVFTIAPDGHTFNEGGHIKAGNSVTMTYDEAAGKYTFTAKVSYTVTVAATTNGTATVDKTSAYEDDTVTITTTPNQGYEVDAIAVATAGGDEVTVTNKTFTMPAENVVVTVTFKESQGGGGSGGGGGGGVSSNVTIDKTTNGKVTVTPTAPSKGSTVTITLTPDTGYVVGTVTVTDKDGKAVELTKVSDTKYTFTMPDGKVKVAATFTKVADGGFT
ncbi:MAG: hypothetical protein HFF00_03865, partial [Ruminiclostridium sp.]|nr:hypothetical protein [Ruminiclostridium sp.]